MLRIEHGGLNCVLVAGNIAQVLVAIRIAVEHFHRSIIASFLG
jgi:hypothetical protein